MMVQVRNQQGVICRHFELAYELPDKSSHLVAELLPIIEPEFEWNETNNLRFYYRYDFLPPGVMTRFIVRVHQDLEEESGKDLCWREGAVLQWENTRAFVKIKPSERLIEIKIHGDKKRELLAIIRREFDHINSSIKKVRITQEIPCNCSKNCLHRFDYEQLLKAEKVGRDVVDCPHAWNKVSLSLLLDGYERKEDRMEEAEIPKDRGLYINFNPTQNVSQTNMQKQDSKQETKIDIDVKTELPVIQSDFRKFKREVAKLDEDLNKELDDLEEDLLEVTPSSEQNKINKAINKLSTFMQDLNDENSKFNKIIKGSEKGIKLAQNLGKTYNKFAQWLALPQVPDLFL
jgi:hypothetical protein